MDNKLGANDPYREMESGEKGIRPDFLGSGEKASGILSAAESAAGALIGAKTGGAGNAAAKGASGASKAASDASKAGASEMGAMHGGLNGVSGGKKSFEDGIKSTAEGESHPRGLYKSGQDGGANEKEEEPKLRLPKGVKAAAPFAILFVGVVAIIAFIIVLPVLMIGALDYNLMKSLGFTETIAILEKVGSYVTANFLSEGKVPSSYASDLAANGIDVGQVLANGDFVKTDTYIADIENRDDLVAAASGFSYIAEEEGKLAMLYNGKVIHADEFMAAVESDPTLYAAYATSADIGTKYYYGSDVEQVYKDMGLSRGNFNNWKSTGNYTEDTKKYEEILTKVLNSDSSLVVGGYFNDKLAENTDEANEEVLEARLDDEDGGGTFTKPVKGDMSEVSSSVSEDTREYVFKWEIGECIWKNITIPNCPTPVHTEDATERASELLNTAVSSGEPYLASNAFIAIEEPVQRARINGDGPVNQVMNTLTRGSSVSYQDVSTGGTKSENASILETANFRAAVSDSKYSKDEAANFARDRVIKVTDDRVDKKIIQSTVVTSNGKKKSSSVVRNGKSADKADEEVVSKANDSLDLAISKKNSDVFQTVIGGNRAIEGGSFLSNTINMKAVGAMPSDAGTVAAYHQETQEVLARKEAADRASRSPFDISSPNTFLGSIVHNMATSMLGNYGKVGSVVNVVSTAASVTGSAIASIMGSATAEGSGDDFTSMGGRDCKTVGTIGVEGDLYCTSHNTISLKYKKENWEGMVGDDEYDKFVLTAMERDATVGVKSAEVCEAYKDTESKAKKILHFFTDMSGLFNTCFGVPDDIATGSKYAFNGTDEDAELYAGRAVYEEVHKILSGEKTTADKIREEYYARHPKDSSEAGLIARRSGMSKTEAEIALAYGDYLNEIAFYDPSDRYDFTMPIVWFEKPSLEIHSDEIAMNLYAWHTKESEYEDLRTRNFVV